MGSVMSDMEFNEDGGEELEEKTKFVKVRAADLEKLASAMSQLSLFCAILGKDSYGVTITIFIKASEAAVRTAAMLDYYGGKEPPTTLEQAEASSGFATVVIKDIGGEEVVRKLAVEWPNDLWDKMVDSAADRLSEVDDE